MTTVNQLLRVKGYQVISIEPDDTVYNALVRMATNNVGALVVLREGQLVGIISERDYARKVILYGKASRATAVSEIMTTQVQCVGPDHTMQECMSLMTDKRIRHLPVLRDDAVIGIISIGDVVKAIIEEQKILISHLEDYIVGQ
ncbi:MAG: CBS domain-containing protein [Anaerolineae bacterium]|nr:CBS domain-containing protein [Anaerolineae bacterium]